MTNSTPTRVRYSILSLLCVLAMITYLDRAMYGKAKDSMMEAVGRDKADFFWVLVAFQLAYACFEVPTGWMGDTFGPRKTLLRIVIWWSAFVALTAFAGLYLRGSNFVLITFGVLIAMQFLFGMGEAGAFPNISRAIYNWFPANQRGFAQGSIWLAARFLGGLTSFIWVLLVELGGLSWRQALWLFAALAGAWCVVFFIWFRNHPSEHPGTNQAERELIESGRAPQAGHHGVPWGKIFTSRNVLALCAMYMVTNFNWYFLMYYLPRALTGQFADWNQTDSGKLKLALMAGAPLLIGMLGCMLGGILDRPLHSTNQRPQMGPANLRNVRLWDGRCVLSDGNRVHEQHLGFRLVPDASRLLQRLYHGSELGSGAGHWPALLGNRVRHDEYGRQPRRDSWDPRDRFDPQELHRGWKSRIDRLRRAVYALRLSLFRWRRAVASDRRFQADSASRRRSASIGASEHRNRPITENSTTVHDSRASSPSPRVKHVTGRYVRGDLPCTPSGQ